LAAFILTDLMIISPNSAPLAKIHSSSNYSNQFI